MGTASTMACITEALGMSLPGTAAIPAVHADRLVAAEETGKAAVRLIESRITPRQVITQKSVENAIRVLMAVGGSTNARVTHVGSARSETSQDSSASAPCLREPVQASRERVLRDSFLDTRVTKPTYDALFVRQRRPPTHRESRPTTHGWDVAMPLPGNLPARVSPRQTLARVAAQGIWDAVNSPWEAAYSMVRRALSVSVALVWLCSSPALAGASTRASGRGFRRPRAAWSSATAASSP